MVDSRRIAAVVAQRLSQRVTFDHCARTITFVVENNEGEETQHVLSAEYTVCPTCKGQGKVVNPSIDEHGITQEDFDQDPDFREEYCRGAYDIRCPQCSGNNVVLVPDRKNNKAIVAKYKKLLQETWQNASSDLRTYAMESGEF